MSDLKTFTFDANGNVTAMYAVKGNRLKSESISGKSFLTETGTYTAGATGIVEVTVTKAGRGKTETDVYADPDGDGRFVETFELDVANTPLVRESYTFDMADGVVVTAYEQSKRGWKVDKMDSDESYSVVTVGTDTFVVKTEAEKRGAEFDVYVDRDGDGLWAKIAEGDTQGAFLNPDNSVDLVGIADAGLLAPAAVVTV